MKALVCGSRDWTDYAAVCKVLDTQQRHDPDLIIAHGAAAGADRLAGRACADLRIAVTEYPADWKKHGRAAGIIRNMEMLRDFRPDYVLAFSDHFEDSRGTRHMAAFAIAHGVQVTLIHHGPGAMLFSHDVTKDDVKDVRVNLKAEA